MVWKFFVTSRQNIVVVTSQSNTEYCRTFTRTNLISFYGVSDRGFDEFCLYFCRLLMFSIIHNSRSLWFLICDVSVVYSFISYVVVHEQRYDTFSYFSTG